MSVINLSSKHHAVEISSTHNELHNNIMYSISGRHSVMIMKHIIAGSVLFGLLMKSAESGEPAIIIVNVYF